MGAEFRATARLFNNYSNMMITHAYESSWAGAAKRASNFWKIEKLSVLETFELFFVVFDER